jgi:hypothetical protein
MPEALSVVVRIGPDRLKLGGPVYVVVLEER